VCVCVCVCVSGGGGGVSEIGIEFVDEWLGGRVSVWVSVCARVCVWGVRGSE